MNKQNFVKIWKIRENIKVTLIMPPAIISVKPNIAQSIRISEFSFWGLLDTNTSQTLGW